MALLFISMIAFSGVFMATILLNKSPEKTYNDTNLHDLSITSTLGLSDIDEFIIQSNPNVEDFEMSKIIDVVENRSLEITRLESLPESISTLILVEGYLPKNEDEIVLSYMNFKDNYKIGDRIQFLDSNNSKDIENLKISSFVVSGFVKSSEYLKKDISEISIIGAGTVSSFGYILPEVFDMDFYTKGKIIANGHEGQDSFSKEYQDRLEEVRLSLEEDFKDRPKGRIEEVRQEGFDKIQESEQEIIDAKKELEEARQELNDAKEELNDGEAELKEARLNLKEGRIELEEGNLKLINSRKDLDEGWKSYNEGMDVLEDQEEKGLEELSKARAQLDESSDEILQGKEEIDKGRAALDQAKKDLDKGEAELLQGEAKYQENLKKYQEGKTNLDLLKEKVAISSRGTGDIINKVQGDMSDLVKKINNNEISIMTKTRTLESLKNRQINEPDNESLQSEITGLEGEIASLEEDNKKYQEEIDALKVNLDSLNQLENESKLTQEEIGAYQGQIKVLEENLRGAKTELDKGKAQLDSSRQQFEDGKAEYEKNLAVFSEQEKAFNEGYSKYEQGLNKLEASEEEFNEKITKGKADLEEARRTLLDGEEKYKEGLLEIRQAKLDLEQGQRDYEEGLAKYNDGLVEYEDGLGEFNEEEEDALVEIADGEAEIQDARDNLNKLKEPDFLIETRNSDSNYYTVNGFPGSLKILAYVFSSLALLISLLVAFTTMTRMVDERRVLIGTFKGLGYENFHIALKYILFGGLSGITGTLLGTYVGQAVVAPIIYRIYLEGFLFAEPIKLYSSSLLIIGLILTVITTSISAYLAVKKTLKSNAAELLRPKAPKVGTRIFLERLTPIWKRLSFMDKITARNIFRYKGRMFMTIIGVAVCMALMILGFGMKYSVTSVGQTQFQELQLFDLILSIQEDLEEKDFNETIDFIKKNKNLDKLNLINIETLRLQIPGENTQDVNFFVDLDGSMDKVITFKDPKTKEVFKLDPSGAVITDKLSKLMDLEIGDSLLVDLDDREVSIRISKITENYLGHYIYLDKVYYTEVVGKEPGTNGSLVLLNNRDLNVSNNTSRDLLKNDNIISSVSSRDTKKMLFTTVRSIDLVIVIIVLISMLLALVVLYNLTNINVSERIRELSTMKVLGFYPKEITEYVFKETFSLSIIGIILGMVLGRIIVDFVIGAFAPLNIMFGDPNYPVSFLISAVFTVIFTLLVMALMHNRLKDIDMVEALKSID